MKSVKCFTFVVGGLCIFFLVITGAMYFSGLKSSHSVQEMATKLSSGQYQTGWYPTTPGEMNYYLEARIVGDTSWTRNAVVMKDDDFVEVRLVAASNNSGDVNPQNISERVSILQSEGLKLYPKDMVSFDVAVSPDAKHIACIPIGIIGFDRDAGYGVRTLEVGYGQVDDDLVKILLIPPNSEVPWSDIRKTGEISLALLGLAAVLFVWVRKPKRGRG